MITGALMAIPAGFVAAVAMYGRGVPQWFTLFLGGVSGAAASIICQHVGFP